MGDDPTTSGATTRRSNPIVSYSHHGDLLCLPCPGRAGQFIGLRNLGIQAGHLNVPFSTAAATTSSQEDSNLRPLVCDTSALPLSYTRLNSGTLTAPFLALGPAFP